MSRIGKKPVALPTGVSASVEGQTLTVKGPKGTLSMQLLDDLVKYEVGEGEIRMSPITDAQRNRAAWGMTRTNVQNLVTGVTEGFTKVLEISGIDRQKVGQVAAEIRRWRKPEPYKGKGIKYRGEYIFRKEGKKK
jgi:large subunit ribosomal protein L6